MQVVTIDANESVVSPWKPHTLRFQNPFISPDCVRNLVVAHEYLSALRFFRGLNDIRSAAFKSFEIDGAPCMGALQTREQEGAQREVQQEEYFKAGFNSLPHTCGQVDRPVLLPCLPLPRLSPSLPFLPSLS